MRSLLLLLFLPPLYAQRWTIQYFYDEPRSELTIADLAFPTPQRGVAVGWTKERGHNPKPVSLATIDGGERWTPTPLQDVPRSLFFLNPSAGWMVGESAIWFTDDGRAWRKIGDQGKPDKKLKPTPPGGLIMRVWFLDAQHGYAAGYQKTVFQTSDGGHTWKPLPDAAKPPGNQAFTAYSQIAFDGPLGLIVGVSIPPRNDLGPFPSWMEPERASKQRERLTETLVLQTRDKGSSWTATHTPLFGLITALRMTGPDALDVFSYGPSSEWPAEVFQLDLTTGASKSVFREKSRKVTDVALFAGHTAFLAAVEPTGSLNTVPIPGKVKILTSSDLAAWKEMQVDYRAEATTLMLAGPDAHHLWAGTDTGMILRLVE
jgi:hypothetical protein